MVKYKGTEILTAIVEKNRSEICIVGRQDSLLGKKNINYFKATPHEDEAVEKFTKK